MSNSSTTSTSTSATSTSTSTELSDALSLLLSNSLVEVLEALETLLVYTKNLIQYPDEKKYRKIKISNIHYQERLGHLPGAQDAMTAIGYVPSGDYLKLDEKRIKQDGNDQVLRQLKAHIEHHLEQVKRTWTNLPLRLDNSHTYSSVQGAGYYSAIGKRHNMEDDEIIVDHFCGDAQQGYFGLYDGHGGRATVDFVVKALHMNLEHELKRHPNNNISEAFRRSYLSTDGQLRRQNILRSGSTSVTCVIKRFGNKRFLFTANVGDSRAVLCRGGKAIRLTIDHKASLPEEAKRITDAGGFIGRNRRVNGVLAISRALGDHMLKENDVVSAVPHCADTELTDEDSFLLLACDGVWDVMTDQEAIDFMLAKIKVFEKQMLENQASAKNVPQESKEQPNGISESTPNGTSDSSTSDSSPTSASASASSSSSTSDTATSSSSTSSSSSSSSSTSSSSSNGSTSHPPDPEATSGPATLFSPPIATSAANALSTTGGYGPGGKEPSGKMKTINDVLDQTSKALVTEALERRSLDNVTVMIIKL